MDPRLQSSFIPKKPIVADARQSRAPMNFFSIIATTLFVLALLACVGIFFYQNSLNSEIASESASLNLSKAEFDPSTLAQLARLDSRLSTANGLLKNHVAISNFFLALGDVTLQSVRFSNFSFTIGNKNTLTITMQGEAEDFNSIALQSDALTKDTYFKNVVVSDFAVEPSSAVGFNVALTVDPSLISYGTTVAAQQTDSDNLNTALATTTTPISHSASTTNPQTP